VREDPEGGAAMKLGVTKRLAIGSWLCGRGIKVDWFFENVVLSGRDELARDYFRSEVTTWTR
jgi:hypothetical protein